MNEITTVGVDLAKDVIVVCAGDASGRTVFFKQLGFRGFASWAANLPPCTMAMEACSSAHFWARTLAALGHHPKLMAADLVQPFRKSRGAKNDRNDAQAILIAALQPDMRFVSLKSIEQQSILACHRMREGWKSERTALVNRVRGLLAEFGIWLGRSPENLARSLPQLIQDEELPARVRALLVQAQGHLGRLEDLMEQCELDIAEHARHSETAQRLGTLNGIGPITASAMVVTIGDVRDFRNGRQLAAWLGLVPRQSSSGGKDRLRKITKRGDTYLRGLLTPRVDRSSSRLNADPRLRTPCAAYILARMTPITHPTRPCREMQSDSRRPSSRQRAPRSRGPPRSDPSINLVAGLTGNSVENARTAKTHFDEPS